jgi:hypothetical protein
MTKIIEITITAKGETSVTTRGFAGQSCRDASRFIEQALGQRIGEQLTTDFHLAADAQQVRQQT